MKVDCIFVFATAGFALQPPSLCTHCEEHDGPVVTKGVQLKMMAAFAACDTPATLTFEAPTVSFSAVISIHRQRCVFGIGWTFPLRCSSGVRFWEVADVAERLLDKLLEDSFEVVEPVSFLEWVLERKTKTGSTGKVGNKLTGFSVSLYGSVGMRR